MLDLKFRKINLEITFYEIILEMIRVCIYIFLKITNK